MFRKGLKASLSLPIKLVVLPVRLSIFAFKKVTQKESETLCSDVIQPFKIVPRHPLHSSFLLRSTLTVAFGQDRSAFNSKPFAHCGQAGIIDELDIGSWKPFLATVCNTRMVGVERYCSGQSRSKSANCSRLEVKKMLRCFGDPLLKQFAPSHLGSVLFNRHPLTCFIPNKGATFQDQIFILGLNNPPSTVTVKPLSRQTNSVASANDQCGCNLAIFWAEEWYKFFPLVALLTRVVHKMIYLAQSQYFRALVSTTPLAVSINKPKTMSGPWCGTMTLSDLSKQNPKPLFVSTHLSRDNFESAAEDGVRRNIVSQTSSNKGNQSRSKKQASEGVNNLAGHETDNQTAVQGGKRKRGKRGKGKRKGEHSVVAKDTACSSNQIQDTSACPRLSQASQSDEYKASTCAGGCIKAIEKPYTNDRKRIQVLKPNTDDLKSTQLPLSSKAGFGKTGRTINEAASTQIENTMEKLKSACSSHSSHCSPGRQAGQMSSKERSEKNVSFGHTSTKPSNMQALSSTPVTKNVTCGSTSRPSVPKRFSDRKYTSCSSEQSKTSHKKGFTTKTDLIETEEPGHQAASDSKREAWKTSKLPKHGAPQDLMTFSRSKSFSIQGSITGKAGSSASHKGRVECRSASSVAFQENKIEQIRELNPICSEGHGEGGNDPKLQVLGETKKSSHLVSGEFLKSECPDVLVGQAPVIPDEDGSSGILRSDSISSPTPNPQSGTLNGSINEVKVNAPASAPSSRRTRVPQISEKVALASNSSSAPENITVEGSDKLIEKKINDITVKGNDEPLVKKSNQKRKRGRRGRGKRERNDSSNIVGNTKRTDGLSSGHMLK